MKKLLKEIIKTIGDGISTLYAGWTIDEMLKKIKGKK